MSDEIFSAAQFILQNEGILSSSNPLVIQTAFADDRVEIVGSIHGNSGQLIAVLINLNLPFEGEFVSGVDETTTPFTLPRPDTYETPVFQWSNGKTRFYRPGLWENYLVHLARGIKAKVEALQMLNGVPINDGTLFGDMPLSGASPQNKGT